MSDTKEQTNAARIRRLELDLAYTVKSGKAAKKALDRWGTPQLQTLHKQLQEQWVAYRDELRAAQKEAQAS